MGYQIPFKSFKNTAYVLEINGGGTVLDGAVDTFVTEEDADTDFFKPVRTQSGTFRYLGSGSGDRAVWLAMIPTNALSIPVKLKVGSDVKWQGYIQPSVYHNDYPANGGLMEHEFAVQCPLSVLDTVDVDSTITDSNAVIFFGKLLKDYIFAAVTSRGTTINYIYLQGNAAGTRARLNTRVMWANFIETDSNGATKSKYTYGVLLEEICKLFGYTCRMHGTSVYFTMPVTKTGDNPVGFTRYTLTSIGSEAGTGAYQDRGSFEIVDYKFCDTEDLEQVHPGYKRAIVRSDINEISNFVEIPYGEIHDQYNVGVPNNSIIVRALDQGDENIYYLIKEPNTNGGTLTYENDAVSMSLYSAKFDGDALTKNKYCRFLTYDSSDVGDPGTQEVPESKKAYGWTDCVELFHGTEYTGGDSTTMFTITSKQIFVVCDGYLYISWKMRDTDAGQYKHMYNIFPTVTAQIRVGSKYWNGSAWTTTASTFTMLLDSDGPRTTRSSINDPQYNGYGIPVTDTMRGIIEFKIIDVSPWQARFLEWGDWRYDDNNGFVPMHDFEIGFVRGTIEDTKHRGNEYITTAGYFSTEYNVDLIFASDVVYGPQNYQRHMPAGLGYLLGSDEKPVEKTRNVNNAQVIAEQELATVIAKYGETTHRLVQVNLFTNLIGNVEPTMMSAGLESNLFPLAISHNWREDITTLTLIELKPQENQ